MALRSLATNKGSGDDEIPFELFKVLKIMLIKSCNNIMLIMLIICWQIWKTQPWSQGWKSSVFIPVPRKNNAKESLNYNTIVLISHASKIRLTILQARFQQYVNQELSDVQAGFRKSRGTRDQIDNIHYVIWKARKFIYIYLLLFH